LHAHLQRRGVSLFQDATAMVLANQMQPALKALAVSIQLNPDDARRYMLRYRFPAPEFLAYVNFGAES
jgi:hypothetical protein